MAAKFVDAIAHMPGMDGEDSDATGAYTQTTFGPECPITWITLPKERWPKAWHNIYTDPKNPPVVILSTNLYGHPLAGLYWGNYCEEKVLKCGFFKVKGWECLYMHKEKGLILSVYVDDFKMGGIAGNIGPMWEKLKLHLDLDPPVKLKSNVYLGMKQSSCPISQEIVQEKNELSNEIFGSRTYDHQGIEKPTTDSKKEGVFFRRPIEKCSTSSTKTCR